MCVCSVTYIWGTLGLQVPDLPMAAKIHEEVQLLRWWNTLVKALTWTLRSVSTELCWEHLPPAAFFPLRVSAWARKASTQHEHRRLVWWLCERSAGLGVYQLREWRGLAPKCRFYNAPAAQTLLPRARVTCGVVVSHHGTLCSPGQR